MIPNDDRADDSIRILYVEDDDRFRALVAESLQRERDCIDVATERDVDGGLRRLRSDRIDCVVSDHELSESTGIEFLEAVREDYPDLPFVLFTGTGSERVASRAISAGVTEYLRKRGDTEQYAVLANRIENVVEQYRSRRTAARRKRRLETLVSNLPGIVYRCRNDPEWPMEYVDGECEALVGYAGEELESGAVRWGEDVLHPDDRESTWREVQAALERGEPFECTYRVVTADGDVRWMWERGRAVDDPDPEVGDGSEPGDDRGARDDRGPGALEGFITDITETTERERELRRSQRRFEAIFEDPNLLVALLGVDGTVEDVNRTALKYAAADREDVIGEPFVDAPWWTESHRDDVERWIERAASGEYVDYETTHPNPAGDPITAQGYFRPVTDERGTVTAIVVSARDVTARRERERELERQRDQLDEFAGFISHDLQSPISVARGRLELTVETGDTAHAEKAAEAVERVDELRTDLAETLRSGEIVSATTPVDVDDALEGVQAAVDPPETMTLAVADPVTIEADPEAFQRLLENLVRNSIEHGGGDVDVRIGRLDDGFYYEDDGPGIDPEYREQVFTPGFSTKRTEHGTGMGLASVRQTVIAHGWDVAVDDAEALDGARFEIRTE